MLWSIKLDSIVDHEGDVGLERDTILVLVPLRLVLHVLQRNRLLHHVTVGRHILARRLVVKEVRLLAHHKLFDDLHEDRVEALRAVLLLPTPALVRSEALVLKVVVAEAVRLEFRSR